MYKELRMRPGCRRHTCSGKGSRGLGVERMVQTHHHAPQRLVVVVVGVRVKDIAKWWKN